MRTTKKKKVLLLFLAIAVGLLLPTNLVAQKGMFGTQDNAEGNGSKGMLGRNNGSSDGMEWSGGGMILQDPTQQAPLGSGLLILAIAGTGYAIVESKKGKESRQ